MNHKPSNWARGVPEDLTHATAIHTGTTIDEKNSFNAKSVADARTTYIQVLYWVGWYIEYQFCVRVSISGARLNLDPFSLLQIHTA